MVGAMTQFPLGRTFQYRDSPDAEPAVYFTPKSRKRRSSSAAAFGGSWPVGKKICASMKMLLCRSCGLLAMGDLEADEAN